MLMCVKTPYHYSAIEAFRNGNIGATLRINADNGFRKRRGRIRFFRGQVIASVARGSNGPRLQLRAGPSLGVEFPESSFPFSVLEEEGGVRTSNDPNTRAVLQFLRMVLLRRR